MDPYGRPYKIFYNNRHNPFPKHPGEKGVVFVSSEGPTWAQQEKGCARTGDARVWVYYPGQ